MLQKSLEAKSYLFFYSSLPQRLAILVVSFDDKGGIHKVFQLQLVPIFLDCCGCEHLKRINLNYSLFKSESEKYGTATDMFTELCLLF